MRYYFHLTLEEREDIMMLRKMGRTVTEIAAYTCRDKSTVSREIARNGCGHYYRASTAQKRYKKRREACRRPHLLDDQKLFDTVQAKFLEDQWSPEQVEGRIELENGRKLVSDTTIYRAIADGDFDYCIGGKKAACRLRHKGKRRKRHDASELRGKIKISHDIAERPIDAEFRLRLGDWEGDTVAGHALGACLVTLVDRKSGFLTGGKSPSKLSSDVSTVMTKKLKGQPLESVTLDRGKENARHVDVTTALGVEFYFALPHHPWQRGSNENTNGLLREYFPKGKSLDRVTEKEVRLVYDKLNRRPRKRLGYRTPYEVHYSKLLHLI